MPATLLEALRLLKLAEWAAGDAWCPWCLNDRTERHRPDCPYLALMAQARAQGLLKELEE